MSTSSRKLRLLICNDSPRRLCETDGEHLYRLLLVQLVPEVFLIRVLHLVLCVWPFAYITDHCTGILETTDNCSGSIKILQDTTQLLQWGTGTAGPAGPVALVVLLAAKLTSGPVNVFNFISPSHHQGPLVDTTQLLRWGTGTVGCGAGCVACCQTYFRASRFQCDIILLKVKPANE